MDSTTSFIEIHYQRYYFLISAFFITFTIFGHFRCHAFNTAGFNMVDTNYPIPAGAIYVSLTGNDENTGTDVNSPVRTPKKGIQLAPAGGTVVFRGGIYYGADLGEMAKPLILQPYPHEKAYFLGSLSVSSGWVVDGATWRVSISTTVPTVICPKEVINPSYPNACKAEQVFMNNAPMIQVATKAEVFDGKFYYDKLNSLLYVGTNPTGKLVEVTTLPRALQINPGSEGTIVRGLGFGHYGSYWHDWKAAVVSDAANVRFESCTIVQNAGTGLGIYKSDQKLYSNYIGYNGYRGVGGNKCDRTQIIGNTVELNNLEHFNIKTCGGYCTVAGIKIAHADDLWISYNMFRLNEGTGFWCDLGCTDATIVKNVAIYNQKHGIYYEVSSRAIVASNVLGHNWECGLKVSGSDNVRIYNNDFIANGYGIGLYDDPRTPQSQPDQYSIDLGLTWNTAGTIIRNNLFDKPYNFPLHSLASSQVNSAQMIAGIDHNGWYRPSSSSPAALVHWCPPTCVAYASHAEFVTATGFDPAPPSIVIENTATDPFFVNEAAGDYNLVWGSPARNAGVALPADIAVALNVPQSPIDMGAIDWKGKTAGPTGSQLTTLIFPATDDATIKEGTPTVGYGADADLIADNDPRQDFLLKFVVSGIGTRTVMGATLVLTATDPGPAGAQLYVAAHNNWNQGTVTWNSAPWVVQPVVATLPVIVASTTTPYSIDVSSVVKQEGTFSFRVIQPDVNGVRFSSKEGDFDPRLEIDVQ